MRASLLLVACCLYCMAPAAQAHDNSVSHSLLQIAQQHITVSLRVAERDLQAIQEEPPFSELLRVHATGGACEPQSPARLTRREERWRTYRWTLACDGDPRSLESRLFPASAPSHLHIAHVEHADGAALELLLNNDQPLQRLDRATADYGPGSFRRYLASGIEHILLGWDHLAFLVLLFLLVSRGAELLLLVTGFTLAHSATLVAATLGWLQPDPAAIEAIIAYSIVLVAIENGERLGAHPRLLWLPAAGLLGLALFGDWSLNRTSLLGLALFSVCYFALATRHHQNRHWRGLLVLLFGLAHGCGFAGALLEVGLPAQDLPLALLGFNLGVEAGQLMALALLLPLLALLRRSWAAASTITVSLIGGLGMYWFISRLAIAG